MVHGTTYTVRYVIKLKNSIDYYDILLPICSANKKMFELINNNEETLLVVFGEKDLKKRFDQKPNIEEYHRLMISVNRYGIKSKEENEYEKANMKYWHAHMYSSCVKFNVNNKFIPEKVYSDEEITELRAKGNEIVTKLNKLSYNADEHWDLESELNKIKYIIKINPIFNPNTKQEIIDLESELSTIELTDEEKIILENVKSNTHIAENIESEGFQLHSYYW
jgi:hypothetical protein